MRFAIVSWLFALACMGCNPGEHDAADASAAEDGGFVEQDAFDNADAALSAEAFRRKRGAAVWYLSPTTSDSRHACSGNYDFISHTELRQFCEDRCELVSDHDLRRLCTGNCDFIDNVDLRRYCSGRCDLIGDNDLHRLCTGNCDLISDDTLRRFCTGNCDLI